MFLCYNLHMKYKYLKQYISIVFLLASLMGALHHHNDLQKHSDCQICTIQSNVVDVDTPTETFYLTELLVASDATLSSLPQFIVFHKESKQHSRAPPKLS